MPNASGRSIPTVCTTIIYGRWEYLNEIICIPVIEYLLVFVLALIIWLGIRLAGLVTGLIRSRREMVPRKMGSPAFEFQETISSLE